MKPVLYLIFSVSLDPGERRSPRVSFVSEHLSDLCRFTNRRERFLLRLTLNIVSRAASTNVRVLGANYCGSSVKEQTSDTDVIIIITD